MKHIKLYLIVGLLASICLPVQADRYVTLKSPNERLEVKIWTEGQLAYALSHNGQILLDKSPIGLILEDKTLGEDVKVSRVNKRKLVKETAVLLLMLFTMK